jgi:hypothetical protein
MPELPAMSTSVEELERRMLSSAAPVPQPHASYAGAPHAPSQPPQRVPPDSVAMPGYAAMPGNVANFFAQFGDAPAPHAPAARAPPPATSHPPQAPKQPESFDAANFFAQFQKGGSATALPPMPSVAYAPTAWGGVQPTKPSG